MTEWNIPFHEIETNWTDEQFGMFLQRLMERKEREEKMYENIDSTTGTPVPEKAVITKGGKPQSMGGFLDGLRLQGKIKPYPTNKAKTKESNGIVPKTK